MHKFPTIAIVGRPNVGKSALFNRIVGKRIAVVHEEAGVTRDRIEATAHWGKREFRLLDTGGVGWLADEKVDDDIITSVRQQVERAATEADLFFFVVDVRDGVVPLDNEVAHFLRRVAKPILLVVNKADNKSLEAAADEFAALGFDKVFPISALHGIGLDSLLDAAVRDLPIVEAAVPSAGSGQALSGWIASAAVDATTTPLKITIVGRPNVGKSSLVNRLLHDERLIVNSVPGTTRDAVDVPCQLEVGGRRLDCVLIDTAGIRRTKKINLPVEYFSVRRAEQSITRCDMAVLLLDATMGITAQDKKVGGKILEAGRGCVIAINKWDLIAKPIQKEYLESVKHILFFLDFAPIVFLSAKTGMGLGRLGEAIGRVAEAGKQTVATGPLNRAIGEAIDKRNLGGSRRMKIYYATQKASSPPTFVLFVNEPKLWSNAAEKFLGDQLRMKFDFEGWPIRFDMRMKKSVKLAKRIVRSRG